MLILGTSIWFVKAKDALCLTGTDNDFFILLIGPLGMTLLWLRALNIEKGDGLQVPVMSEAGASFSDLSKLVMLTGNDLLLIILYWLNQWMKPLSYV